MLSIISVQSENRAIEAQKAAEAAEEQRIQVLEELQSVSEELQTVEKQKADTEAELEEKARIEAEKKREIERLEKELQAKRAREAEARRLAQERANRIRLTQTAYAQSAGNTYAYGNCTWYVKNRAPDIPNGLGNANMWLINAQRMGMSTGSQPKVGAVAQTSGGRLGHVAIVDSVNSDGTVTISEMNFEGFNVVSSRTVHASSFNYIYR